MAYPRILMDKFIIYMDPSNRFRVRLHRFKTRRQNGGAVEKVHSHKWHMSTILLRGRYVERVFDVADLDEETDTANVSEILCHSLSRGDTNSLAAEIPHQVVNESDDECAITLFVRGPSLLKAAKIFDPAAGRFYRTFDPLGQLRVGLEAMGRLDADFH